MQAQHNTPQDIPPMLLEARSKIETGQLKEAIDICRDLLTADSENFDVLNTLAIAYLHNAQIVDAAEIFALLVLKQPNTIKYKGNFIQSISILARQSWTTEKAGLIKQAIQICLEDEKVSHTAFIRVWHSILMQDQVLNTLPQKTSLHSVDFKTLKEALNDPFLNYGLKRFIGAGGASFEYLMTFLRRLFLLRERDYEALVFLPFLCALAEHCHLNEYVYAIDHEERAKLRLLEEYLNTQELDIQNPDIMAKIALLGCYKDIDRCEFASALNNSADAIAYKPFADAIKLLITDPLRVRALQTDIPLLCPIKDDISSAVRDQYEDNPYPRWRTILAPSLTDQLRAKGHERTILIAGCGTGKEILNMALHYPEADLITGIDLSTASLAYGQQKAQQLGIKNVEFIQADILQLAELDRQFDMVVCSGVLHHMRDPVQGWKTLIPLLKPGGIMKISLYSEIARRDVIWVQKWIQEKGFAATPQGISDFRQEAIKAQHSPELQAVTQIIDFYSMSMCRDLLFHVQEHVYTFPKIAKMLDTLEMQLVKVNVTDPGIIKQYKTLYPDDPMMVSLNHWHDYEQQNPNTFIGMYNFFCRPNNYSLEPMPDWIFVE